MPDEDKTEPATPKRRQEAREEGKVAKSIELNTAFLLLITAIFFYFTAYSLGEKFKESFVYFIELAGNFHLNLNSVDFLFRSVNDAIFSILLPFFMVIFVAAFLINIVQVGFMITPKVLELKFDKINPVNGLKNMFSLKSFGELVKSFIKAFVMAYILWVFVRHHVDKWQTLTQQPENMVFMVLLRDTFLIVIYMIIFIIFVAIMD